MADIKDFSAKEKSAASSKDKTAGQSGRVNNIEDDNIGGASAGGVAGTGGVSTNDVGNRNTSKQPLTER